MVPNKYFYVRENVRAYVIKAKNGGRSAPMDSGRSLPRVKSIRAIQWRHWRVLKNVRYVRTLCKQTQKHLLEGLDFIKT